jgi:hypothetical protein
MIENINYIQLKNAIIDEVFISKNVNTVNLTSDKNIWDINTILLAKFLNNLEAGNVGLGGLTIDKFKIRRRDITTLNKKELAIINTTLTQDLYYLDKTGKSQITYEYEVSPMSGDIEGEPFSTTIKCNIDYWWISDDIDIFPLFANLEVSDINTNIQRYSYDTFNKYPIISYGEQKYQSGTITTMLLDVNLQSSKNYRDKFDTFINNQKQKILRNPNGDIWIIDTHTSRRQMYTNLVEDISNYSFEWVEVDDYVD